MYNIYDGLFDPNTGEQLDLSSDRKKLVCKSTKYDIECGIPRILPDYQNYSIAFGDQWKLWQKTQLDSYTGTTITRDRLYRCLGKDLIRTLSSESSFNVNEVLEVGCGAGRFTEILLSFPNCKLTSIDFSDAVETNAELFPQGPMHRVIQCDINNAPFKKSSFDLVVCFGVIQHTPSPELTIEMLLAYVRPGGSLVIDHYAPDLKKLTKLTANIIRPLLKRMPRDRRIYVCHKLVDIFYPLHQLVRNYPLMQAVLSRISPISTHFHTYPQLSDNLQKEWAVLETHDGLTDWHKHLRTVTSIRKHLVLLNGADIEVWKGGNGVEARCKKR